ncbi:MAG: 4-alpha-glucanotransferase, partial [Actinomycetota bacterium]
MSRRRVRASPTSLLAGLKALDAQVDGQEDVAEALRGRVRELWERPLEPVLVAWGGRFGATRVRLPLWVMDARRRWTLALEGGEELNVTDAFDTGAHGVIGSGQVDGSTFVEMEFVPQLMLPAGYHSLHLEFGASGSSSLVVAAPRRVHQAAGGRAWGVFLPLYALRTRRSWGLGDLTDFGDLLEWMSGLGGNVAATLPMLSGFLSTPFEPSPYSPASRLFWNELYLDVTKVSELEHPPEAGAMLRSRRLRGEIEALQAAPLADHRGAMAAKRGILEVLAGSFFARSSRRPEGFNEFARDRTVQD